MPIKRNCIEIVLGVSLMSCLVKLMSQRWTQVKTHGIQIKKCIDYQVKQSYKMKPLLSQRRQHWENIL